MARKLFPHTITVGTQKTVVYLANVYETIGALIGVDRVSDTSDIDSEADISDLISRGQAIRIRVGYGTEGVGRLKYAYVACDLDNAKNMSKLVGKAFKGATIQTVGIRRRRKLG